MKSINIADAHDLQYRTNLAEQELSIEHTKFQREKRKTCRLQNQVNEYHETLTRSIQVGNGALSQTRYLSEANYLLAQEIQKQRIVIETLEAVIQKLHTQPGGGMGSTCTPHKEETLVG
jgi:hypothetical protein